MNISSIRADFLKYRSTYLIVIITVAAWLVQFLRFGSGATSAFALIQSGAIFPPMMTADPSQLWRLLTPLVVHIGWMHLASNMLVVFFMGRMIEDIFGHTRYAGIYLLSGLFGNAAVFLLSPTVISAGASGSIFGLFGAIAALGFFTGSPQLKQIGRVFVILIVAQIAMNVFELGTVNIWAHLAGAIGGIFLAAIFPPQAYRRFVPSFYKVFSSIAFVVLIVVFVALPFLR